MSNAEFRSESGARFLLGDRWITPNANEVGGVRIDAKSMGVLMALVDAAPNVVPHAEILARVWPDVVVVDNVVHQAISQLRKALGDNARVPRYIENIPRRGYRLRSAALVSADDFGSATEGEPPGRNSLLVLPFSNLCDEEQTGHFAAGVHEDILARLSRIQGLTVLSRTSALVLASRGGDVVRMAADASVGSVLTGSIRRSFDRIRLSVQLLSLPQNNVVWAETYDRKLADIFAVQDELAQAIASQLRVRFDESLREAFSRGSTRNVEAYDLVLKAREAMHVRPHDLATITSYLEQAIALDPCYADAYGWLASVGFPIQAYGLQWKDVRPRAIANIDRALAIDPDNVPALAAMAYVATRDERAQDAGLKYLRRALEAAPGSALAHLMYGNRVPDYRERLLHWHEAHRLDPFDAPAAENHIAGLLEQRRVDEAHTAAARAARLAPANAQVTSALAAVHFAMGDSVGGLRIAKRAAELSGGESSFAFDYVNRLFAMGLGAAAWRWLDAILGTPRKPETPKRMRAWYRILQPDTDRKTIDAIAADVDSWPITGGSDAYVCMLKAFIASRRADDEGKRGNATSRALHLAAALAEFQRLLAMFPAIESIGGKAHTRTFPGDVLRVLLWYLVVARQASDHCRAKLIEDNLGRILREQIAPEGAPLERALLAALAGDRLGARREFQYALVPGSWCLPTLEAFGVLEDEDGLFHGIAADNVVRRLIDAERDRRAEVHAIILAEAPALLEPGNLIASNSIK